MLDRNSINPLFARTTGVEDVNRMQGLHVMDPVGVRSAVEVLFFPTASFTSSPAYHLHPPQQCQEDKELERPRT